MTNTQIILAQLADLEAAAADLYAEYQAAQQRQPPRMEYRAERQEADVTMCHWLSARLRLHWLTNSL